MPSLVTTNSRPFLEGQVGLVQRGGATPQRAARRAVERVQRSARDHEHAPTRGERESGGAVELARPRRGERRTQRGVLHEAVVRGVRLVAGAVGEGGGGSGQDGADEEREQA